MTDKASYQRPEGALFERAAKRRRLSSRGAATASGLSDARYRQIVKGYQSAGAGQLIAVEGPPDTVARIAQALSVSPDELREAGRDDAADVLMALLVMQTQDRGESTLDRFLRIREQLGDVIDDLTRTSGAPPAVQDGQVDQG